MGRWRALATILPAIVLAGLGVLADRGLAELARRQRAEARAAAREASLRAATAVRAALAGLEQGVAEGRPPAGVVGSRLAIPPARTFPLAAGRPYASRPRAELAQALESTAPTPSGLPEAVVAAVALGEPAARTRAAQRLLSGELPMRPDDLAGLLRALGVAHDQRAAELERRLRALPDPGGLPEVPRFHRRLAPGGRVDAAARSGGAVLQYEVPVARLAALAELGPGVRLGDARPGGVGVEGVEGLAATAPTPPDASRPLAGLRAAAWGAVLLGLLALLALERAVQRERRALERERAFLANVTHELRTPLAAIRLLGETLAQGRGRPDEYGALVAHESDRLGALLERVLAASRAEEAPRFAPVVPDELARSVVELSAARARRREVRLRCDTASSDAPLPRWDGEAVRQALAELVDNAVKHGPSGGAVTIQARRCEPAHWRLAVHDEGAGVRRVDRSRIFGRFERGPSDAPGTGLGLWLVERVARAHGGRVEVEGGAGRGCTFALILPEGPPAAREGSG